MAAGRFPVFPGLNRELFADFRSLQEKAFGGYLLFRLLLVFLTVSSALARPLEPVQVIDALEPGWRIPLAVRADGHQVAYCITQPSRKQAMLSEDHYRSRTGVFAESIGNDVWLADVEASSARNLTQGKGSSFAPVWSPDGKRLAFVSDRDGATRLWIWEPSGFRRVSSAIVWLGVGWERPVWTPDGRGLIVKVLPSGMSIQQATRREVPPQPGKDSPELRSQPVRVYDSEDDQTNVLSSRQAAADLSLVEVASGRVRRLASQAFTCGWWVSPNGKWLAYTQYRGLRKATSQMGSFDLRVIELRTGASRTLASGFTSDFGSGASWSPDSRQLALFTQCNVNDYEQTEVLSIDLQGRLASLAKGPYFQQTQGPTWLDPHRMLLRGPDELVQCTIEGKCTALARFKSTGLVCVRDGQAYLRASNGLIRVNLSTGVAQVESDLPCLTAVGAGRGPIYFLRDDLRLGSQLWCSRDGQSQRLHQFNQHFSDDTMGRPKLLEYGSGLKAALLLPPDYQPGRPYPTVLLVYGGQMGSERLKRFGLGSGGCDNMHLLASRGYIVAAPDIPIDKNPVADIVAAVEPAVDALIEQGYADPERIAVMGHSYGGYTVLSLITRSHRFKAAISRAGSANLVNQYLSFEDGRSSLMAYVETGQGKMHCTLWENPGRYLENSPVFALDKVQTPLLLIHGDQDNGPWVADSGQVFVGLRRLGKKVIYLSYPGEGHWEGTWTRAHLLDYWQRVLHFLQQCGV